MGLADRTPGLADRTLGLADRTLGLEFWVQLVFVSSSLLFEFGLYFQTNELS